MPMPAPIARALAFAALADPRDRPRRRVCCCGWTTIALVGLVLTPGFLSSVFVGNLVALVYRIVAIVDAYRVTEFLNAHDAGGDGRLGPGAPRPQPAVDRRPPRGRSW